MPQHTRNQTLREIAEELCLPLTTLRQWAKRDDLPFDRPGPGKPVLGNADEVAEVAATFGLTGKPGRPKPPRDESLPDNEDPDYWLMRWRRAKALREEGAVIAKDDHHRTLAFLAAQAATKLEDMIALAPSLVGKTAAEIEADMERAVASIREYLSDPGNYRVD